MMTDCKGSDDVDPMCGSVTLLMEAALMALKIAPGRDGATLRFSEAKWLSPKRLGSEVDVNARAEEKSELVIQVHGSMSIAGRSRAAQRMPRVAGSPNISNSFGPMETLTGTCRERDDDS